MKDDEIKMLQQAYDALEADPLIEKIALCVLLETLSPAAAFILPEANGENPDHQ